MAGLAQGAPGVKIKLIDQSGIDGVSNPSIVAGIVGFSTRGELNKLIPLRNTGAAGTILGNGFNAPQFNQGLYGLNAVLRAGGGVDFVRPFGEIVETDQAAAGYDTNQALKTDTFTVDYDFSDGAANSMALNFFASTRYVQDELANAGSREIYTVAKAISENKNRNFYLDSPTAIDDAISGVGTATPNANSVALFAIMNTDPSAANRGGDSYDIASITAIAPQSFTPTNIVVDENQADTVLVTVASTANFAVGQKVDVVSASPAAYNVTNATVTEVLSTEVFRYRLPAAISPTTAASTVGTVSNRNISTVRVVTKGINGLSAGDTVVIAGTSLFVNGSYEVVDTTGTKTFTYIGVLKQASASETIGAVVVNRDVIGGGSDYLSVSTAARGQASKKVDSWSISVGTDLLPLDGYDFTYMGGDATNAITFTSGSNSATTTKLERTLMTSLASNSSAILVSDASNTKEDDLVVIRSVVRGNVTAIDASADTVTLDSTSFADGDTVQVGDTANGLTELTNYILKLSTGATFYVTVPSTGLPVNITGSLAAPFSIQKVPDVRVVDTLSTTGTVTAISAGADTITTTGFTAGDTVVFGTSFNGVTAGVRYILVTSGGDFTLRTQLNANVVDITGTLVGTPTITKVASISASAPLLAVDTEYSAGRVSGKSVELWADAISGSTLSFDAAQTNQLTELVVSELASGATPVAATYDIVDYGFDITAGTIWVEFTGTAGNVLPGDMITFSGVTIPGFLSAGTSYVIGNFDGTRLIGNNLRLIYTSTGAPVVGADGLTYDMSITNLSDISTKVGLTTSTGSTTITFVQYTYQFTVNGGALTARKVPRLLATTGDKVRFEGTTIYGTVLATDYLTTALTGSTSMTIAQTTSQLVFQQIASSFTASAFQLYNVTGTLRNVQKTLGLNGWGNSVVLSTLVPGIPCVSGSVNVVNAGNFRAGDVVLFTDYNAHDIEGFAASTVADLSTTTIGASFAVNTLYKVATADLVANRISVTDLDGNEMVLVGTPTYAAEVINVTQSKGGSTWVARGLTQDGLTDDLTNRLMVIGSYGLRIPMDTQDTADTFLVGLDASSKLYSISVDLSGPDAITAEGAGMYTAGVTSSGILLDGTVGRNMMALGLATESYVDIDFSGSSQRVFELTAQGLSVARVYLACEYYFSGVLYQFAGTVVPFVFNNSNLYINDSAANVAVGFEFQVNENSALIDSLQDTAFDLSLSTADGLVSSSFAQIAFNAADPAIVNNAVWTYDPSKQISTLTYVNAWNLFLYKDKTNVDMLVAAGTAITNLFRRNTEELDGAVMDAMLAVCERRKDCFAIFDGLDYASIEVALRKMTVQSGQGEIGRWGALFDGRSIFNDTDYTLLPVNVVKSIEVASIITTNRSSNVYWLAPAGFQQGRIPGSVSSRQKFIRTYDAEDPTCDIARLYDASINATRTTGQGQFIYGQKTLLRKGSALNRLNVVMLVAGMHKRFYSYLDNLVFQSNTSGLRADITSDLTAELALIKSANPAGITDGLIICDDSNNTPAVIDRNELIVDNKIIPTRSAEFITLRTTVQRTGSDLTISTTIL
jgi:hypothetical protein